MQPLQFRPIMKQYLWGGRKLGTLLKKPLPAEGIFAESWEIADHHENQSEIMAGEFQGKTLRQLLTQHQQEVLGADAISDKFPLLIKFLDCCERLSVQVHPNDSQANNYLAGEVGKSEAWVVLQANPGSLIYAGLKKGVTRYDLVKAVSSNCVEDCLHQMTPKQGDCFYIPAGTVHALGKGIVIAEIQQSSDLTFRLHDWNRVDQEGNARELHIEQAISCINFDRGPIQPVVSSKKQIGTTVIEPLVQSRYFNIQRLTISESYSLPSDDQFHIIMTLSGSGEISGEIISQQKNSLSSAIEIAAGKTVLLPAQREQCLVEKTDTCNGGDDKPLQVLDITAGNH